MATIPKKFTLQKATLPSPPPLLALFADLMCRCREDGAHIRVDGDNIGLVQVVDGVTCVTARYRLP